MSALSTTRSKRGVLPARAASGAPGVKHWHGGSKDSSFAHIAVNTNPDKPGVEWFDRITSEEYDQIAEQE